MPKALRVVGKYSLGLILILLPGRVYCQSATPLPPAPSAAAQTQRKPDNQEEKPQHSPAAATGSPGHITMSRVALDLGNTALYNAAAEFWPDIHRKLHRIF